VCAVADLLYESYINLAPPFRLYAAAAGRSSTRSADWKLQLPIFVRVHPWRVGQTATPCHLPLANSRCRPILAKLIVSPRRREV